VANTNFESPLHKMANNDDQEPLVNMTYYLEDGTIKYLLMSYMDAMWEYLATMNSYSNYNISVLQAMSTANPLKDSTTIKYLLANGLLELSNQTYFRE